MTTSDTMTNSPGYTGTQVNYYLVCPRKLWLFSRDVTMEHTSELVDLGRLTHEESFQRERKEIAIGRIKIDFSTGDGVIHEVKHGKSIEEAHRFQLLYYLYHLKQLGADDVRGELHYPKLRRKEPVELTPESEAELETVLSEIDDVLAQATPPPRIDKLGICKKCSYYELCYV